MSIDKPDPSKDWRNISNEAERYAAYLCSREWSMLKRDVRSRSRGICERCLSGRMSHVHHLTYARKYREHMDDLLAVCLQCHDFIHGKSDYDPVANQTAAASYLADYVIPSDVLSLRKADEDVLKSGSLTESQEIDILKRLIDSERKRQGIVVA